MFFNKNVYCSPVEGTIHLNGKPLSGLVLTRKIRSGGLKDRQHIDHATTDNKGHFHFDEVSNRTFLSPNWMSANPFVSQAIHVEYEQQDVLIWLFTKHKLEAGSEVDPSKTSAPTNTLKLDCDLSKIDREIKDAPSVQCSGNGLTLSPHKHMSSVI